MNKPSRRFILTSALIVLALSGGGVLAHHGVTGQYDMSTPIVIGGMVTRTTFAPPHPIVTVRVEQTDIPAGNLDRPDEFRGQLVVRAEDIGQDREIELSPVRTFYDLADRVRVGDRVLIVALRNCLAPNQLRSSWIRLADGEVVSYTGGLHRRVDGCN